MKTLISILSILFLFIFTGYSQKTVNADKIIAKDSLKIDSVWFTSGDIGSSAIIDSIYSISDTLFFVTDSGTFKMGREIGQGGTTIIPQNILELRNDSLFANYIDTGYVDGATLVLPEGNKSLIYFVQGSPITNIDSIRAKSSMDHAIIYFLNFKGADVLVNDYNISSEGTFNQFIEDLHIVHVSKNLMGYWRFDEYKLESLDSLEVQAIVDTTLSNFNPLNNIQLGYGLYDDGDTLYIDTTLMAPIDTVANMIHDSLEAATDIRDYLGYGLTSDVMITVDTTVIEFKDLSTITLLDNTTANINIALAGASNTFEYEMLRGVNVRAGNFGVFCYSTLINYTKGSYYESVDIGVTINSFNVSGGYIRMNYTTTSTGSNVTMNLKRTSKL